MAVQLSIVLFREVPTVDRVELFVPLFSLVNLFLLLDLRFLWGIKFLWPEVLQSHLVPFSDLLHLLALLLLLPFLFQIDFFFLKVFKLLSILLLLMLHKEGVDGLVEIVLFQDAFIFTIKNADIAVHARYIEVPFPDYESGDRSCDSFVFRTGCPVLSAVELEDLADAVAHVAYMIAFVDGQFEHAGPGGCFKFDIVDGSAMGAPDVVDAELVAGVQNGEECAVSEEGAIDVIDRHFQIQLVVLYIFALPGNSTMSFVHDFRNYSFPVKHTLRLVHALRSTHVTTVPLPLVYLLEAPLVPHHFCHTTFVNGPIGLSIFDAVGLAGDCG